MTSRCAALLLFVLSACGEEGLPAPTSFEVSELSGGVHLTWVSDDAAVEEFIIQRKPSGGEYIEIARLPIRARAYHDVVEPGTYKYRIRAAGGGEVSDWSAEKSVTVP